MRGVRLEQAKDEHGNIRSRLRGLAGEHCGRHRLVGSGDSVDEEATKVYYVLEDPRTLKLPWHIHGIAWWTETRTGVVYLEVVTVMCAAAKCSSGDVLNYGREGGKGVSKARAAASVSGSAVLKSLAHICPYKVLLWWHEPALSRLRTRAKRAEYTAAAHSQRTPRRTTGGQEADLTPRQAKSIDLWLHLAAGGRSGLLRSSNEDLVGEWTP
ncbi:hypothetical protein V498_02730 [Pseudogymnoascus sp. VKM F-4517 (FW-2822)]|nr:hypothetical protein V498_02730 [Pseudogymnoascus sp. VKM F-4517 (FW-2822)]